MSKSKICFLHPPWSSHSPVTAIVHARGPLCQEPVMRQESSLRSDCPKPPLLTPAPEGHNLGPSQVNARASTLAGHLPIGQGPPPMCSPLLGGLQLGWDPHSAESAVYRDIHHPFVILSLHAHCVLFPCDSTFSLAIKLYSAYSCALGLLSTSDENRTPTR